MKKLMLVSLIIVFAQANPQAFQQGRAPADSFNQRVDQAQAGLRGFLSDITRSRQEAEALIEYANRLNPQTAEDCERVRFVTEFCFVNFAKELKEYQERMECRILAKTMSLSLADSYVLAGNKYKEKNCARFVPKPKPQIPNKEK